MLYSTEAVKSTKKTLSFFNCIEVSEYIFEMIALMGICGFIRIVGIYFGAEMFSRV